LDDARKRTAAAGAGRQARGRAVPVSVLVLLLEKAHGLFARGLRSRALSGSRRVSRRSVDGGGASPEHAGAARATRICLRDRRRASGVQVLHATGGGANVGARHGALSWAQPQHLGGAGEDHARAIQLSLLGRRAETLGQRGAEAFPRRRRGPRAVEQQLPRLSNPQRPSVRGAAFGALTQLREAFSTFDLRLFDPSTARSR